MRGRMVSVQLQVRVQHAEDSRCKMKLILRVGWESCPTALRRSAAAREEDGGGRELECPGGGLCVLAG